MPRRYFNWKLAIVLVISVVVLGVSAFGLRKWRRANRAEQDFVLGNKAYEEQRWEEAAEYLGSYIALERDDVPTMLKYADAQLNVKPTKRNRVLQAIGAYRTVLRLERDNAEAAMQLTEIYLSLGSPGEAELTARRQLEVSRDPGLRRMLALALAGQRKFKEAADELKVILKEHPDHILSYETLGQLIEQRPEDFQDLPSDWYDRAVENNPSSALAYIIRAGYHRRIEDHSSALADLELAEKHDLSDPSVRLRLAKELISADELEKAEMHLSAVYETSPTDQELWTTWANLALKSQSQEKMLKIAETGLKELSSQPWDFIPLATELFIRCGRLDEANDCITKMSERDISRPTVTFLRGLVAAERGQLFDAVKYWQQSLESGNKSASVRLALASALSRLGNTQSAVQQLRTLISENPGSFDGYLALAKLQAQAGNWAETVQLAARAMSLSPENREAVLLHVQAQMQLLMKSSGEQGTVVAQTLNDVQGQLSFLEKYAESSGEVKLLQIHLALQQRKIAEAESLVAQLKDTDLPQTRIVIAETELLVAQDKIDDAILRLSETREQFPENLDVVRYLALLLDRKGNQEECEAVMVEALDRIDEPIARRELGLLLAQFYARRGQNERAYPMLKKLAEKLPNDVPVKRRLLLCEQVVEDHQQAQQIVNDIKSIEGENGWQWRYEQAKVWFAMDDFKNRYPQIVSLLQENMQLNPNDQISRVLLARAYERSGEMRLALSIYRETLRRSPDDLRVIIPAVAALYNARQYDEAEEVLNRASTQRLYHPELQRLQFQSYLRRGQLESASDILHGLLDNDPNNQAACLSLALLKVQQGEHDEASELLSNLKAKDPDSLPIAAAQIQISIRQNKNDEAMRLSNEIVSKLDNSSAYILRARTYATLGQTEEAVNDLDHAISLEPENIEVWLARSDFYRSINQTEKATSDIQTALDLAPENIILQKRAIPLLLASGDPNMVQKGKDILKQALESNAEDIEFRLLSARSALIEGTAPAIENARQIIQRITKDQPEMSVAWVLLGQIAIKQGQLGKAMEAALGGLAYKPNDKNLLLLKAQVEAARSPVLAIPTLKLLHELDPNDLNTSILMAETYSKVGEPAKAVELLKEQLTTCDESTKRQCMVALAVAFYKNGNKQQAQQEFESLLESEPNDTGPLLAQVQLLKDDKEWSGLSRMVNNWYNSHPRDSRTTVNIARELMIIEENQAKVTAEEILRMVLKRDADCSQAMSSLAILLQIKGRNAESAQLYRQVLEIEPDNVIAMNNLAWIMSEVQGEHQQALELAQKGLKLAPKYYDLIDTRGVIYYRLGQFEKAVADFTECIELNPGITRASIGTRFYLARAYAELGEKKKAILSLNEALELDSQLGGLSTADLAEARGLLKHLQEGS